MTSTSSHSRVFIERTKQHGEGSDTFWLTVQSNFMFLADWIKHYQLTFKLMGPK